MIRVVLADDHHLVRQALRSLLEGVADIRIVGEAGDGRQAIEQVQQLQPDVLVVDLAMPGLTGIQTVYQLRTLGLPTRVVVLTMHTDESLVRQALKHGVRAYVLKRAVVAELLDAIRAAARGDLYVSPAVAGATETEEFLVRSTSEDPFELLSPRQIQVWQLIAEGHTNNAIGKILQISPKTVEKHRAYLMATLNAPDVTALVRLAIKHRLLFLDGST